MIPKNQTLNIIEDVLDADRISELDRAGYHAVDAWNQKTVFECLFSLNIDPWDYLGYLRRSFVKTKLRVTLCGQALLGGSHFSDEITEAFIAALSERNVDVIRVYDALNDPRNLETCIKTAKKYGACAEAAMIYAESLVYSPAFFAGYAAQLAAMGADLIAICAVPSSDIARELVMAVKNAVELPVTLTAVSDDICDAALEAGADYAEICEKYTTVSVLSEEIEKIRSEAGYPPLAPPILNIINVQALNNQSVLSAERYSSVSKEFKDLILGKYGRTPAPIDREFSKKICGDEPLILVRPADLLEPDYDAFRTQISPYFEGEEDILTYAVFGREALSFFEYRKAKKYSLDLPHAHPEKGIHTV